MGGRDEGEGRGGEAVGLGGPRTDLKQRRSVRWPKGKYEAPLQASAPSLCALRNAGRGGEGGRRVLPEYGVRRRLRGGPQATIHASEPTASKFGELDEHSTRD